MSDESPRPSASLAPGSVIGVLGAGQLGKMTAHAATQLGYRVHLFSDHDDAPGLQVTDRATVAPFTDLDAVRRFAQAVDVVTYETEHVHLPAAHEAQRHTRVHPSPEVLATAQDRLLEKQFLHDADLPTAPFAPVHDRDMLRDAVQRIGTPAVLKTARFGYDGKGQRRISDVSEVDDAWREVNTDRAVLEKLVPLEAELSVIVARNAVGEVRTFGPIANVHVEHILDHSTVPAPFAPDITERAHNIAERVGAALDLVGVCCVEMFLTTAGATAGELLVNELAPRPHNSGHLTIEACHTSQFEQLVRAIAGLPLGDMTPRVGGAAMINLLGQHLPDDDASPAAWHGPLRRTGVHLHLYGKRASRHGRKMGHLTATADTPDAALSTARDARDTLRQPQHNDQRTGVA